MSIVLTLFFVGEAGISCQKTLRKPFQKSLATRAGVWKFMRGKLQCWSRTSSSILANKSARGTSSEQGHRWIIPYLEQSYLNLIWSNLELDVRLLITVSLRSMFAHPAYQGQHVDPADLQRVESLICCLLRMLASAFWAGSTHLSESSSFLAWHGG